MAKATPAFDGCAADATDLTIIPINMGEPILIARGSNAAHRLGFSPHGAGRDTARSAHVRRLIDDYRADARGLSPNNISAILARRRQNWMFASSRESRTSRNCRSTARARSFSARRSRSSSWRYCWRGDPLWL